MLHQPLPATDAANEVSVQEFGKKIRKLPSDFGRGLDISVCLLAFVLLSPAFLAVTIAIKIADPGPVFFRQRRIGKDGRFFRCWKFRTMVVDAEQRLEKLLRSDPDAAAEWKENQKLRVDPRITPLGRFLRRTSLDELPQLMNILVGEMSLVGPRPIVEDEVKRYGERFALYCRVRPGLTGLWQISGRSDTRYFERVLLDARYVCSKSVLKDIKIMVLTIPCVMGARGSC